MTTPQTEQMIEEALENLWFKIFNQDELPTIDGRWTEYKKLKENTINILRKEINIIANKVAEDSQSIFGYGKRKGRMELQEELRELLDVDKSEEHL